MQLDDVLTELVADSGDRLLRVAYQLTHDRGAAQDLVQDALLRVYRSVRRRGLTPEDWYGYLRRAVINEYVRTRRLRSSTEVVTDMVPERPAAGSLEDRAADQAQLWAVASHQQEPATMSGGGARVTGLACPARYAKPAPWVPARPVGVDGRSRLVPQQTPRSALICAYAGSNMAKQQAGWALSGRRPLAGGLANLAGQLSWQPRRLPGHKIACTLVGGPQTNYLIGLSYPGGATMWVAATAEPNECVAASNGEFTNTGVIGPEVSKAFTSGRWPARQPVACNQRFPDIGRLGEDSAMVPAGTTSLTICTAGKAHTFTSGYQAVVRALNRLPTRPSTGRCSPSPETSASMYQLLFSYPRGPLVSIDIAIGCYPEVGNTDLQSHSASSVLPVIQALLKAK